MAQTKTQTDQDSLAAAWLKTYGDAVLADAEQGTLPQTEAEDIAWELGISLRDLRDAINTCLEG